MSPSRTSIRAALCEPEAGVGHALLRNLGILLFVCGIFLGPMRVGAATVITNTNTNSGWDQSTNAGWNTSTTNPWNSINGTNNEAYFTNTSGFISATNVWLNALYYAATSGTFQIGQSVGQGTLNFVGTNPWIYTAAGSETLTIDSALTLVTNLTITNNANLTIAGTISGSGSITQSGSGTLTLSGSNSYSGGTRLNAGTVDISTNAAFGSNTVTFASNATVTALTNIRVTNTFVINSNAVANLNEVSGATFTNSGNISNSSSLVVSGSGNINLAGVISGTGSLTQSGSGTLSLASTNSYSGGTFLDAGTVAISTNGVFGAGSIAFLSNATVSALTNLNITNSMAISSNATATFTQSSSNTLTNSGGVSGFGSLTQSGSGTMLLTGSNNYTGVTTILGGTLEFLNTNTLYAGSSNAWTASNLIVSSGATVEFCVGTNTGAFNTSNITVLLGNLTAATNSSNGALAGASIGFDSSGTNFTLTNGLSDSAGIGGGGLGLAKFGIGTLTITGVNTYTGATLISGGTLLISGSGVLGNGTYTANITNKGSLVDASSANLSLGGVISGSGTMTLRGSSTLTLTSSNSYTGGTFLNAGTVAVSTNGVFGAGSVTFASNATVAALTNVRLTNTFIISSNAVANLSEVSGATFTNSGNISNNSSLVVSGSGNINLSGVMSGAGSLTQGGSGTLLLASTNSYSGGTFLDAGTFAISTNMVFGAGGISFVSNATVSSLFNLTVTNSIVIGSNATATFSETSSVLTNSGVISGAGSLTQSGGGTLILSGSNSYSGTTLVSGGVLQLNGTNSGAGDVIVTNTGTLAGNGTTTGTVTVNNGASITAGNGVTPGSLTIGGLTLNTGSVFNVLLSNGTGSLLTVTGSAILGGTLSFSASGLTNSTYTFLTDTNGYSGTFAITNSLPSNYQLIYGSNSVYLQSAVSLLGTLTTSFAGTNAVITGGATNFLVGLSNSGSSGDFVFNVTNGSNTAGGIGSTTLSIGIATNATGMSFTGTTVGTNQAGVFTVSETAPGTASTNGTVLVNVYGHAAGSLATNVVTMVSVHAGYTNTVSNNLLISNAAGLLVALQESSTSSATNLNLAGIGSLTQGSYTNVTLTLAPGQVAGSYTDTVTVTFGDASSLNGAVTNLSTTNLSVVGLVYSGQSTWATGSGNWTNFASWDANGGTPGLSGTLSSNDTATFNTVGLTSGVGTVTLNTNATLMAVTFSNALASYKVAGSGTITMQAGSNQPVINNLAGSNSITTAINLATNVTVSNVSGSQLTLAGPVSGGGGLTLTGSGTLSLTSSNGYLGGTFLDGGTLALSTNSVFGFGSVTFASNTTIAALTNVRLTNNMVINSNAMASFSEAAGTTLTNSGNISGAGSLTQNGIGTLSLLGSNSYWGGTFLDAGTVVISNSSAFGSGTLTFSSNAVVTDSSYIRLTNAIVISSNATATFSESSVVLTNAGVISGAGSLTQSGSGTLILSGSNSYSGATLVSGGVLLLNGVNSGGGPVVVNSGTLGGSGTTTGGVTVNNGASITAGNGVTPGSLTIGGLTLNTGSVFNVLFSNGTGSLLTVTGSATLGGTLSFSAGGLTNSSYTFLTDTNGYSGTFAQITNLPSNYQLIYGSNSVYLQSAGSLLGTLTTSFAGTNAVITGGTTNFLVGLSNSGSSGDFVFNATNGSNTVGVIGSTTLSIGSSTNAVGLSFTGTTVGTNQAGGFTVNETAPATASTNGTVLVNVYGHAAGSLATNVLVLSNAIVGYSGTLSGSIGVSNAAGFDVALQTASTSTNANLGINDINGLANGGNTNLGITLTNQGMGVYSNTVAVVFGDASSLNGAVTNLSTTNVTVTGTIYGHAAGSLATNVVSMVSVHAGYTNTLSNNLLISNASGLLVALRESSTSSATNLNLAGIGSLTQGSYTNVTLTLAPGQVAGSYTDTVIVTFGDASSLNGAVTNLSTTNLSVVGLVYSGQSTWATGSGNWTNFANWDANGGTPGLSGTLSSNDTATFNMVGLTSGVGTVTLNTNATLMAVTFSNALASYNVAGSGTITMQAGSNQPVINNLAGSNSITTAINLTTNVTVSNVSGSQLTMGGAIRGAGGIILAGAGTLSLTSSNSYSGGTYLDAGTVMISTNGAFGFGSVTVASNAIVTALTNLNITNNIVINSNGMASFSEALGTILTNSGNISGAGSLAQTGSGTLSLVGSNSYSGGTLFDGGTLILSTNGALGSGGIEFVSNATVSALANLSITNNTAIDLNATATFSETSAALTNSGVISGSGSITQSGSGTLILSGSNSYSGTTLVAGGALILNGVNNGGGPLVISNTGTLGGSGTTTGAVTVNSGASITPGNGVAPGSLTIGWLTLNTGSVFNVMLGNATSSLLTVTGGATLGGTISFSASGLTNSSYTFLTDTNGYSGTFSQITNLPSNYQLIYGSNSVYLQSAVSLLGTLTTSFAGTNAVITGGTTNFLVGLSNNSSSGDFVFNATNGSNTAGVIGSTTLSIGSATNAVGLSFTGTTVGTNQAGGFTVNESAPATASTNGTVIVNVYGHAGGSLATNVIVLSNAIVGYGGTLNGSVGVSNAAGLNVALQTASTSSNSNISITDISGLANGGYTNLAIALTNQGMGAYTNTVAVTFGDASSLNGAVTNLSTTNVTVTGTVYGHASGSLATNVVTMVSVHAGYTNTLSNNLVVSNAAGLLVALQESATSSATNLSLAGIGSLTQGSSTNVTLTLASGQAPGSYTDTVTVTFGDASSLNGAVTNLSTTNLTVIGLVYSGHSTWVAASGNWTNFANWDSNGGTPGLSGTLSSNDTATFNTVGLTSGIGTVTLNTNASLMALTFSNALASYNVAGIGTITMQSGSNQPVISNLAGSNSITTAVNLATNVTVTNVSGSQLTMGGAIRGAGGIILAGAGTLSLAASNSYTGGTFLAGGIVNISSNGAFGSGSISFVSNTTVSALATLSLTNTVTINSNATATFTNPYGVSLGLNANISNNASLVLSGSGNLNLNGIISGAGSLTQSGYGTTTLAASNSYSRGTFLDAGTLAVSANSAFGSGTVTFVSNAVVNDLIYMSITNNFIINSNATATFTETSAGLTNSGVISGLGSLAQGGGGTLALLGSNSYSGGTLLEGGTLMIGTNLALGTGSITFVWNATVTSPYYMGITNNITINSNAMATFTESSTGLTNSGTISGLGSLVQGGAGSLILSGSNSYAGGTVVNSGTLVVNNAYALGSTNGNLSVATGLLYNLGFNTKVGAVSLGNGTLSGSGLLTANSYIVTNSASASITENLAGSGSLTKSGAGTLMLSGSNSYAGVTTLLGGTLEFLNANSLYLGNSTNWTASKIIASSGATVGFGVGINAGSNAFTTSNITTLIVNLTSATNSSNGILAGASIGLDPTGTNFTLTNNLANGAGTGGGTLGLAKLGSGTLNLTGTNTYSGATLISGGTLQISGTGLLGGGTYTGNITNNGTFTEASSLNQTLSGVISGYGALYESGSNSTLNLSGTNTYLGAITISAGTLEISGSSILGGGSYTTNINNNGNFIDASSANQTLSGVISGSGSLSQVGSGTLILSGSNTYNGPTLISSGTLLLNGTNSGASSFNVTNTGTLGGSGRISGTLTIAGGATVSPGNGSTPGTLSVQSVIWNPGGNYNWQVFSPGTSAGSGYDTISISGALNLSQLSSSNQFNINLWTLSGTNPLTSGTAPSFNPYTNYSWTLASFGSITNFFAADFLINTNATNGTGGFANPIYGTFGIATNSTNLVLTYTTVFTPGATSLYVGSNTSYNSTSFTSGPIGYSNAYVGFSNNASSNTLTVANTNTLLFIANQLTIGNSGGANTLVVTNGGVIVDASATIGSNSTSSNNTALVSGAGSLWSNSGSVTVAYLGSGTITVANGGVVTATNITIASQSNSAGVLNVGSLGGSDGAGTLSTPWVTFGSGNGRINFNQSNTASVSAVITGSGSVYQLGSGTTILSASNTYSGPTLISSGTLLLNGANGGGSAFSVTNSGTLGGSGRITGTLTVARGGTITPGNGITLGTLSIQSVIWNPGGNYNWQIFNPSGAAGSGYSTLSISGALNLSQLSSSNQFDINLWTLSGTNPLVNGATPSFNPYTNYSWTLASFGSITNFSAADFLINTSPTNGAGGFANSLYGTFGVSTNATNLILTYTTALTPSTNWLYVGSNTPNNSTNFTSGAIGYSNAYVGYLTNSSSNSLTVANTNTVLALSGSLFIGNSGSANSLVVSNGGIVADTYIYIGNATGSSNNSVLVTGVNSAWSNSGQIYVGSGGAGNSLVISNGGKISDSSVYLGLSSYSSNNSAQIYGVNSVWSNSVSFVVGAGGGGNSLVVSNGGMLSDVYATIGSNSTSSNNTVLVSGSGSLWRNSGGLTVGNFGGGTLTVANGGVVAATNLTIASQTNSIGVLNIGSLGGSDGAGTLSTPYITFGNGNGSINFNQSNTAVVSAAISGNGSVNQLGSGTTGLSGSNTYGGSTLISAGTLLLNGTNSGVGAFTVTNSGTLGGSGKISGALTIASGGTITPSNGFIPGTLSVQSVIWNAGGSYNWQVFNPSGAAGIGYSSLSISSTLNLSQLSSSNQFNINLWTLSGTNPLASGAAASFNPNLSQSWTLASFGAITNFSAGDFLINTNATNGTGGFANSLNGSFAISTNGTNLLLTYTSLGGTNASITIGSNSANVSTNFSSGTTNIGSLYIGFSSTSSNNSVTISGSSTVLSGSGDVIVGSGGSGNSLVITNGAVLQNANGFVDDGPGSSNNTVVVNGSGSTWVSQAVTVGTNGNNNSLIITNGGAVLSSNGVISDAASASNNYALITGNGSIWNNSGTITVGNAGSGTLTVANGGSVSAANIVIASQGGSAGTLNIGSLGGNDASGLLQVSAIAFGSGSGFINFNQSDTATVASSISGNGSLNQLGSGTTVLTGSNTYSGFTAINGGTLQIGSGGISGGLGSSAVSNNSSLVFDLNGNSVVVNPITGSGSLSQIGGGTVILSGSNNYSGVTTLSGGTLEFLTTNSLYSGNTASWTASNLVVSSNATIAFGVGTNAGSSAFTAGNITTLLGNLTASTNVGNGLLSGAAIGFDATGTNFVLSNNIADTTGGPLALATMGAGTLTLTGNNTYSGETLVNGGMLSISGTNNLGSGVLLLSSNTVFQYTGAGGALANAIQVTSGTGIIENVGNGLLTLSGTISKQNTILEFAGGSFNVTGQISGGSAGDNLFNSDLILSNATVTLSATNSYYGPTYLLAGSTLTDGINNAMPVSTILNIGGVSDPGTVTNVFDLAGFNQSINGLTNAGSATALIYDSVGGGTLTLTGNSGFSGSIGGGGTFMDLVISGPGTVVTLTGNNTYTGSTWIAATLDLGATGQLSGTTNVVINGGTLLLGGNGKNNPVNTNAALTLNSATLSMAGLTATSRTASQTFASLTLTANSTIDFGNLTGTSSLTFGTITMNGNSLSVDNYNGSPLFGTPSTTGGAGQYTTLYDLNASSLSPTDLSNISFYSGNGTGFLGTGTFQGNEIIAVPEPGVIVSALLLFACLVLPSLRTRWIGRP